jgi:hypothetical protein
VIHTYFYQTVVHEDTKTTYRKAVSALPQVPDVVYEAGWPHGWDVREVRYNLDQDEVHVVLGDRLSAEYDPSEPLDAGEIDVIMQAGGWQRAPRDARFCVEVEFDIPVLPHIVVRK